jgi:membrane protease YdiL (CAAX protease family)
MTGETHDTTVSPPTQPPAPRLHWSLLLLQIIAVSGIPTQVIVAGFLFFGVGMRVLDTNGLPTLEFIATVSFIDTALVALLIRLFLRLSGESSHAVFFGGRPFLPEFKRGLLLIPAAFVGVITLVSGLRYIAPWLHTVPNNPLEAFMRDPFDAAIFAVVVLLAGGIREELQRGFILHRSDQGLGGAWKGNLVFGLVFGALHIDQGFDVALAIGLLGMGWGLLYIRRRSVVAGMVSHAGLNLGMVVQGILVSSLGVPSQ